jgi:hypothetical protein
MERGSYGRQRPTSSTSLSTRSRRSHAKAKMADKLSKNEAGMTTEGDCAKCIPRTIDAAYDDAGGNLNICN